MSTGHKLEKIIAIYNTATSYGYHRYAQVHNVDPKGRVLEGKPLTTSALRRIFKVAFPKLKETRLVYIEDKVLASSGARNGIEVWWVPPDRRSLFFEKLDIESGIFSLPGLIFVVAGNHLRVFAVRDKVRPRPDTRLYVAPFFNMTDDDVCLGNAERPSSNLDHKGWEDAFFNSAFSELNRSRRTKSPNLVQLWKELRRQKKSEFPVSELLPNKNIRTLGELILKFSGGNK